MVLLSWITVIASAQDSKQVKHELKEAKKAEKIRSFEELSNLLESRRFVFEANQKQNGEGLISAANPGLNYIKVEFENISAKLEISGTEWAPYVSLYYNAMLRSGVIKHWELLKDKKRLNYYLTIRSLSEHPSHGVPNLTIRIYNNKSAMVKLGKSRKTDYTGFHGYIKEL